MTSIYEPWDAARGAEIIAQHTHLEGATLVILHARPKACAPFRRRPRLR
jgi:formate dehydrogenase subunit gamma